MKKKKKINYFCEIDLIKVESIAKRTELQNLLA